jgi:Asp-tRNA(Asn)/Glu-tRNA(Gln) amidotransferase A subunit family amidase
VTWGRIPWDNSTSTVTKAGPLAGSATDVAIGYAALSPNEAGHYYSILYGGSFGPPSPSLRQYNEIDDLSDIRIGVYDEWFDDGDEKVVKLCRAALDYMKSRGAVVVPIKIPHLQLISVAHGSTIAVEFASKFDWALSNYPNSLEAGTAITAALGASFSALEFYSAAKIRAWAFNYVGNLFTTLNLSVIATPTIPILPPPLDDTIKSKGASDNTLSILTMRFAQMANFLGLPAYSIPVGLIESDTVKLPVGFQVMGNHWDDDKLIRIARSFDAHYKGPYNDILPEFTFDPFDY